MSCSFFSFMLFEMYFASFFYAILKLLSVSKSCGFLKQFFSGSFSCAGLGCFLGGFFCFFFSCVNFSVVLVDVCTVFSSVGFQKREGAEESQCMM